MIFKKQAKNLSIIIFIIIFLGMSVQPILASETISGYRQDAALRSEYMFSLSDIPDETFRNYLKNDLKMGDSDGRVSSYQLQFITRMDLRPDKIAGEKIKSLSGIEYFTQLQSLNIDNNELTSLDLSNNYNLGFLNASNNQLMSLKLHTKEYSGYGIYTMDISNNQLHSLNLSTEDELYDLKASNNQLTSLDVSNNSKLAHLNISSNQITSLDFVSNPNLSDLNVSYNELTSLNLSSNNKLQSLNIEDNQLSFLNFATNAFSKSSGAVYTQTLTNKSLQTTALENGVYTLDVQALLNGGDIERVSFSDKRITCDEQNHTISFTDASILNTSVTYSYNTGIASQQMNVSFVVYEPTENININIFKNANFRWYAKNRLGLDKDNDGFITERELNAVTDIDISYDVFPNYITSLEGIEYFPNLESLTAKRQPYTSLDISKNIKLKNLDVSNSALSSLNIDSNTALETLNAQYTALYYLNLTNNTNLKTTQLEQTLYNRDIKTSYTNNTYSLNISGKAS